MAAAAALAEGGGRNGLRPINLSTDLASLAELLEICFNDTMDEAGRATIRELRALSRAGSLATWLNRFDRLLGGLQQGFVWMDDGRLIGNTTVTPANYPRSMGRGSIIANVAVHPDYRRQGLARILVEASLDLIRSQGNRFAVLQVDADNDGAQRLYEGLDFRAERTFTRWQRSSHQRTPNRLLIMPPMSLRQSHEWRAEYELAELVRPNRRGGMGWLRPIHPALFRISPLKSFFYGFTGRSEETMIIYRNPNTRERDGILGSARLHMVFGGADRLDLLVHPFEQGKLEDPLINYMLRRLEGRRRSLIIEHPTDDESASTVFRKYLFEPRHTVINMRLDFS